MQVYYETIEASGIHLFDQFPWQTTNLPWILGFWISLDRVSLNIQFWKKTKSFER
jgi:hypothetical protein